MTTKQIIGRVLLIVMLMVLAWTQSRSEDAKPLATAEELTKQLAEQKQENERLTKMLNAYAQKYQRCDQELTVLQTLGIPAQQTQRKPLATPSAPPAKVDEQTKK